MDVYIVFFLGSWRIILEIRKCWILDIVTVLVHAGFDRGKTTTNKINT